MRRGSHRFSIIYNSSLIGNAWMRFVQKRCGRARSGRVEPPKQSQSGGISNYPTVKTARGKTFATAAVFTDNRRRIIGSCQGRPLNLPATVCKFRSPYSLLSRHEVDALQSVL